MPASGSGMDSGAGADRPSSGETGRTDDPWRRIETEQPERDAARKAWDETHDPSAEFEYAARPLGDDYGRDRPQHRELTDEQRADLEEAFGRPADELLALRDQDPRAGHNRDEAGRILDQDGNPRPEQTSEQVLREAERQASLYGPDASTDANPSDAVDSALDQNAEQPQTEPQTTDAPDLQAPSDLPGETNASGEADGETVSDSDQRDGGGSGTSDGSGDGPDRTDPGRPDDDPDDDQPAEATDGQPTDAQTTEGQTTEGQTTDVGSIERAIPSELHERIGELAAELRSGRLTPAEAADQLDKLRPTLDSPDPETAPESQSEPQPVSETNGTVPYDEPSTEVVDAKDGLTYERPERREGPDLLEPGDNRRFSSFLRKWTEGGEDVVDGAKEVSGNMVDGLRPAAVQPSPSWDTPQYAHVQGDAGQYAGTAVVVALLTAAAIHGLKQRRDNRTRTQNEENRR